jgi:hypothetical protein
VRWLRTNSVAGIELRHSGGSLPEADKRPRARTIRNGVASSYWRIHGVRGMGRLRCGVQRMAMLGKCGRACVCIEHSEAAIDRSWHGGDAEGILSVSRWRGGELERGGGHVVCMGVLAHGANAARG